MNFILLFLISLPLSILGFMFEVYPRILNKSFGVDVWTHLLYLKEYHKQKGIPKEIDNGFLVPGRYDYPPAFILIMSKLPFKTVEKYEFIFSPFFDSVHLIIIFFISYFLTGSLVISLTTQLIYLAIPIIILENSSATPRSLGYSLFTLVFFLLFLFQENGNIYLIPLIIFFGSLIFLSHRFTTQGFLFFSIFFSLVNKNTIYIIIFAVSFFLAVILSKGFYLEVLKGHIGNLIFWYKKSKYRFYHQVKGNYNEHRTNDFVFKLYNQFLKFPPFVLTITNPWTLFVFYFYFHGQSLNPIILNFTILVLFSYLLAVSTIWIPKLRFLGEGQRYFELSAFPTALISSISFHQVFEGSNKTLGLILYFSVGICAVLTILVIQRKAIIKDRLRSITPEMIQVFKYLKNLKNKPSLLCIPHQITTSTIYHTKCPVFVNADYKSIDKISDVYPFLRKNIRQVMKENNLDWILLNQDYAGVSDLRIGKYKKIFEFKNFIILKPI